MSRLQSHDTEADTLEMFVGYFKKEPDIEGKNTPGQRVT